MNEQISHSGAWFLALLMILLASWTFYRFFAPTSWREWRGAGLVQAFIIALYAEMYGFPLTIYLLVRVFGIDRTNLNANLWSSLLGVGELGMLIAMALGYVLVIIGIGLFARGWRQIHAARRRDRLVTTGLYRFVRHPQYTGLFLALFGEGVVHWPTLFSVGLFPFIVLAYYLLARSEERKVMEHHGEAYRNYRRRVPMFLPHLKDWRDFLHHRGEPENSY